MYFLLDACKHPTTLSVLYFGYLFWEILAVLIPIGLIIMLMIDFTKAVVINKEDEQVKSMKLVGKRIMYAVFIFATPWLVSLVMSVLGSAGVELGGDYTECINTVKNIANGTDNMEKYDKLLKAEEELEKRERNKGNGSSSGGSSSSIPEGSTTADKVVNLAKGELGNTNRTKYDAGASEAWCAYFTTWVLNNVEMNNGNTIYNFLGSLGGVNKAAASGLWPAFRSGKSGVSFNKSKAYGGNYTPKKGDVIWFQWTVESGNSYCRKNYGKWNGSTQCSDHVGLVVAVRDGIVYTIEGNSGGKVSNKQYQESDNQIIAYGSWYNASSSTSQRPSTGTTPDTSVSEY